MEKTIKILFVDDVPQNCKSFKMYFRRTANVLIHSAHNVEEALHYVNEHGNDLDVVIADYHLQGSMSGEVLLGKIMASHSNIYRMLTSASEDRVAQLISENPNIAVTIQTFLSKPWHMSEIKEIIFRFA